MDTTSKPKFLRVPTKGDWKETARYRVTFDGRRTVGIVMRRMDSSRTGGIWSARRSDGTPMPGGFATRREAAMTLAPRA